ncbi:MAG: hypothetical protein H6Q59_2427 [Firmicutes bacterium]|nr:hypothetical protein [Bacillota bacterium]
MLQWEYRTLEFSTTGFAGGLLDITAFNEALNGYGREGWELVNCFDTNQSQGASRKVIAVLKRQTLQN